MLCIPKNGAPADLTPQLAAKEDYSLGNSRWANIQSIFSVVFVIVVSNIQT